MTYELKPCPFCNVAPSLVDPGFYECKKCNLGYSKIKWNKAWVWKEISRLQSKVKELEKERDEALLGKKDFCEMLISLLIESAHYSGAVNYNRENAIQDILEATKIVEGMK